MNKRNIVILGTVLILAIVVVGGFWVWRSNQKVEVVEEQIQSQNQQQGGDQQVLVDTSDWNTYRNEEYGFEVKYPEEWEISLVENGFMKVRNEISECALVPEGCPVVVLYDKNEYFNSDYVSIDIKDSFSQEINKTSKWLTGMLSGCHVTATKNLKDNNGFSFYSFYEAMDLNDEEKTNIDIKKCQSNNLNPYFEYIVKSFIPIN
jgi:hypothetical protein